ncbi:CDP-Glycerol:Poly(glycerophosphate) glycerophosphotransferase [Daejeonella rubra]|uniref:CDP-Glycerol:Poly(Glycerophosphate) glycerophosphotransferase n=1 Tax=Daejeonella rubra TaxID=990371 RepID=A0A1G9WVZ0_9SPHI|nr:CDP-glycerol glycerophosphotransferase family protein [Daejeonella rubra]SDM88421.1 CDP-Glycerol:Poly(glycerophosphate) glycerophosphotransferase [Daejeonella rubra]
MSTKKNLLIFISLQTYLRNWIDAGAFSELHNKYNILYVIPEYDWDPREIENYGIQNYKVIKQATWRKFLFRRILLVTMVKYSKRSMAFRIKIANFSSVMKLIHTVVSWDIFYQIFLSLCKFILGRWKGLDQVFNDFKPDLVIAPSLAADSFTIDFTHTANKNRIKSLILINSWDNLVSKGVMPIQPTYVGLWGKQAWDQAVRVQRIAERKLMILGVPRFERYFSKDTSSISIHEVNNIPPDKKIILYPATSLPFDDIQALTTLDNEISTNPMFRDYVILFRAHPEMLPRVEEKNVLDAGLKNVYIDSQTAKFYFSRFENTSGSYESTINSTSLDYYPALLKSIVGMVCPATTLSLEGLINGKPCVMICYNDGKNHYLSPDQIAKFENVQEILGLVGVFPCYEKGILLDNFRKMMELSTDPVISEKIKEATLAIVYVDELPYASRLSRFVEKVI